MDPIPEKALKPTRALPPQKLDNGVGEELNIRILKKVKEGFDDG